MGGFVLAAESCHARATPGYPPRSEVLMDARPGDVVAALDARGRGEGAVALDQFLRRYTRGGLEVVDVLREVGEEFALVLEQADECVGGGKPVAVGGEDVLGHGVEDRGVLPEERDVEHLLRVREAEMRELRVESGFLGAEIGDPQARGDAGAG